MQKKLWEATISQKENSNLRSFEKFLINKYNFKSNKNYKKLLKWSLQNPSSFWSDIWDFAKVKGVKSLKNKFHKKFTKNQFLVNSKLNFAENLLVKNNNKKAITFISENGFKETRSWIDLKKNVEDLATFFKKHKIKKGVRVAAYMPNQIETVECFLATAAIGAVWSSCSPDFGTQGLIERFSQIKPKILILTDSYYYNGKEISILGMMWNWLVSALASEASIVLFDGFPMHKNKDLLFKIAEKEKISLLGVSAKFIDQLKKLKLNIKSKFKLKYLKTICSTGSPLSSEGFEYIYRNVKKNVHLSSISGGTDIVSCFVLGNIFSPVFRGEIQNNGLGMDVDVFSERGESILNQKGELVCKSPFPSMPNKFWNDPGGKKYQSAYFLKYKNIWYHGDYAERKKNGGYIIYGRSDATLNPGGVRLGTAEIYSVIENFKEIKESIVVGQKWDNDVRIILFVVMSKSSSLNDDIILRLKKRIRSEASPRHVPSKIIQVSDIPRTKNGKIVELAVKNTIEGSKIKNVQALANPKVLNEFKNLKQLKF